MPSGESMLTKLSNYYNSNQYLKITIVQLFLIFNTSIERIMGLPLILGKAKQFLLIKFKNLTLRNIEKAFIFSN